MSKTKKWFKPMFEFDETEPTSGNGNIVLKNTNLDIVENNNEPCLKVRDSHNNDIGNSDNWMKHFEPKKVEDLAVHTKKIQDVEQWISTKCEASRGEILLLSGPPGSGKTATVHTVAQKHNVKVTEWITPLDINLPSDYGEYEFKEKQSSKFLDFILNAANVISLIDNNSKKLVMVEDLPNLFIRTSSEFTMVLQQYKDRAKSPIVFICSESHTDNKNTALNLFTNTVKEQFNIHHISFNGVAVTGLKSALKRVSEIISRKFATQCTSPSPELIDCVVNSSGGDVRSAVLNLYFACLKGAKHDLDTSVVEKDNRTKTTRKRKHISSKFMSIGKDETVSILHGVGRVLNPKKNGDRLSHPPADVIEQFLGQSTSFVSFLGENYLPHFSSIDDVQNAAAALSTADYLLAEWTEKFCQEYGLYVAVAGLMLANISPVSAWNPVRGPKTMKIQYPSPAEFKQLDSNMLYKGKVLVSDYQTYCKIIPHSSCN